MILQTNGTELPARLFGLSPSLDPKTRSRMAWFDVEGDVLPPDRTTGEVILVQHINQSGAWVPLSALRQGPNATWRLLVVKDGVIGLEAAEVLHLEAERAFVRGTFQYGDTFIPGARTASFPARTFQLRRISHGHVNVSPTPVGRTLPPGDHRRRRIRASGHRPLGRSDDNKHLCVRDDTLPRCGTRAFRKPCNRRD